MNAKLRQLFYFNMLYFKNWTPRNTSKMDKNMEFAVMALLAMQEG